LTGQVAQELKVHGKAPGVFRLSKKLLASGSKEQLVTLFDLLDSNNFRQLAATKDMVIFERFHS